MNILIIMSDQHNTNVMGCAGDPVIRTPNLDRLAGNGVLFEHCYTPSPLCAPARASFMTSRYPSGNQTWGNRCCLPSDIPTFAHSLGAAGYETVLAGRMHFNGPDQRHGFEKRFVGDLISIYPGGGVPCLNDQLLLGASGKQPVQISGSGRPAYQVFDEEVTGSAIDHLRSREDDRPLCIVVGWALPHCPYICPPEDFRYYYDRVSLPQLPDGYLESAHPSIAMLREHSNAREVTDDQIRCARAAYCGMITQMDRQIGRLLAALEETGLAEDTVVIYTSDHGDSAGEHGLWTKMNYFEGSAGVPLIVSWPGRFPKGVRVPELANLIDLGPTVTDLAEAPPLPDIDGRSLLPLINGDSEGWTNETFSELGNRASIPPSRMIRRDNWKLMHFDGLPEMLFNLDEDPGEFIDRSADPSLANLRDELTARVTANWSPDHIRKTLAERARANGLLAAWWTAVQPHEPELWRGNGKNEYRIGRGKN
jgi:choline-sulfatase